MKELIVDALRTFALCLIGGSALMLVWFVFMLFRELLLHVRQTLQAQRKGEIAWQHEMNVLINELDANDAPKEQG